MRRRTDMWRTIKWPVIIALVGATALAFRTPVSRYFDVAKSLDIFATLFKEVNAHYVDEVDPEKLIHVGIDGMLETLDPYTSYISEADMDNFRLATTGQYAGIGALIGIINKKVLITHPYKGFPANKAGLHVGDEILAIDGKSTSGKSTAQVSTMLKGQPGTTVALTVRTMGQRQQTVTLQRERIKLADVSYAGNIDGNIAYIRLNDFTVGASREVADALNALKKQGATKLVLDLRDNPGGLLHEAVNIVSLFVPKGNEVVSTKGKDAALNQQYSTLNVPLDTSMQVVVLVNDGSASAAEIVAGALQDYDRAVLIGGKTFGKGLVQTTRPLGYDAQLKVTTARYYIPSGRCIQALDYAHRRDDGTVTRFADSLKSEFKTKHGRRVYDGGGLDPDIVVEETPQSAVATALASHGLTFEFASLYCTDHPAPSDLTNWKLSDADYEKFLAFVRDRKLEYQTGLEEEYVQLREAADREKYTDVLAMLNSLKTSIEQVKRNDLVRFREEIKASLESQIAFHWRLNEGYTLITMDRDASLGRARQLLRDHAAYDRILSPSDGAPAKP